MLSEAHEKASSHGCSEEFISFVQGPGHVGLGAKLWVLGMMLGDGASEMFSG